MMRPHLRSRIGGTAWRMQRTAPRSLLSNGLVPVLLGHRKEAARRDVGGVVDQDVEPAELPASAFLNKPRPPPGR
jgi:hypothetical protein